MKLEVDATDVARAIFHVKQSIPVEAGKPLILLYPQWLPGKHGPRGALAEMTGLKIRSNGKLLEWTRDPVEVYAFHVDTPAGTKSVDVEFQFTSPVQGSEGRIVVTPAMMNVQWEQVALYPAGHFTRAIQVQPSITLPKGWTGVAALDGAKTTGNRIDYGVTDVRNAGRQPAVCRTALPEMGSGQQSHAQRLGRRGEISGCQARTDCRAPGFGR